MNRLFNPRIKSFRRKSQGQKQENETNFALVHGNVADKFTLTLLAGSVDPDPPNLLGQYFTNNRKWGDKSEPAEQERQLDKATNFVALSHTLSVSP